MMTVETWLAFAAATTAVLLVPHPIASLTASFSASWGRKSAFVTIPAFVLAFLSGGVLVTAGVFVIASLWPSALGALSWLGLSYLMLHVLYAYQDPQLRYGPADNDNLPETRPLRIFGYFILRTFKSIRYFALTAAIAVQFFDTARPPQEQYINMISALAVAAMIAALAYAILPAQLARKRRRSTVRSKAPYKPGTRFIARRAVSAGYRRIAA
jgi:homoserine/homoserine lactone efflux protein